ncbi:hypothetical protein KG112_17655 [Nocardioides sp. zg-ZUI104]|uniref:hypothetical protein n=1 Tax=Nocardioides faecalis TaxID=2803858 RepID=UPI001BD053F6|nr:hypothetical protein [Nocardioides faecalis]MBS4754636.1 hypothetical protein [Nocardioides faecalis]
MTVAQQRVAVVKALKAHGAKARRGHLRLTVGELHWYVDPLVEGVGQRAALRLEVGCWTAQLPPEPDGGAVDCPLLLDLPVGDDPVGAVADLVARVGSIGDLPTLAVRLEDLPGALVDRKLRDLLATQP